MRIISCILFSSRCFILITGGSTLTDTSMKYNDKKLPTTLNSQRSASIYSGVPRLESW